MRVMCAVKGCSSVYASSDTPSPNGVRYVCSHHTDEELRAAGILVTKRTDKKTHFQDFAFDRDLG
jgi:hypothetical protein